MHTCSSCGCACYCNGDIEDHDTGEDCEGCSECPSYIEAEEEVGLPDISHRHE